MTEIEVIGVCQQRCRLNLKNFNLGRLPRYRLPAQFFVCFT